MDLEVSLPRLPLCTCRRVHGIHPADRTDTAAKVTAYFKNPVSAGPMMVKTFQPGTDLFVAVANPNYWAKPVTKELRVVTIPDANSRLAAFMNGSIDYVMELPLSTATQKWDKTKFRVGAAKDSGTFMIAFNMGPLQPYKPLKDARVRQAISLAINRAQIMKVAFAGLGGTNCGMQFNGNNKYYLCSFQRMAHVIPLLHVSCYQLLVMQTASRSHLMFQTACYARRCSGHQENLAVVNIDVTINMVTPDTAISDYINRKNWGFMWFGNNAATPILQLSNWFKKGGVWANNANVPDALLADSGRLLDEAASSSNAATIKDKLTQVEKIAWDLSTFIPVGTLLSIRKRYCRCLVQALMPGQLEFVIATNPPLATS
ncbi:MAG: ABC transporter substrate-binding protein [Actinomycetota bacterium]